MHEIAGPSDEEGKVLRDALEERVYRLGVSVNGYRSQTFQVVVPEEG